MSSTGRFLLTAIAGIAAFASPAVAQQVLWRGRMDSDYLTQRPAVGPDGSVYANPIHGSLYAFHPDGTPAWVYPTVGLGDEGPVVIGPDGTIYFVDNPGGTDIDVHAVAPDGTARWVFTTSGSQGLIAGPAIGPDGSLYAVTDIGGIGAFSLDPSGKLRWSNVGSPAFAEHGALGSEIAFHDDRFFVAFDEYGVHSTGVFYGLSLDGKQLFAVDSPAPLNAAQVVVGRDAVYLEIWTNGIRLGAFDFDGNHLWTKFSSPTNVLSHPSVGPDGTIYLSHNLDDLYAVAPDGSTRWTVARGEMIPLVSATPTDAAVIFGGMRTYGAEGYLAAVRSDDGKELWKFDLPYEDGGRLVPTSRCSFSADGQVAYFGTDVLGGSDQNPYCYVYAVQVGPWATLGHSLAGTAGEPQLTGRGTLAAGTEVSLEVERARSSSLGFLIVGLAEYDLPFAGGVMVPSPDLLVRFRTDANGVEEWRSTWPASVPADTPIYFQAWIPDPKGPQKWSATNALRAITP